MATIAQTESTELVSQFGEVEGLDWVVAASIVVVTIVASRIAFRLVAKAVGKTNAGDSVSRILGRLVSWLIVVIGLWFALNTIGVALGPLIGALGIAGLALAFAFQDILENLIAGLLMLLRRPITIGDEVVTNDYEGKVVDITLRAVEINTFDGERVYVPNAMVWKNPLTNTTKTPTRRTTLDVGVSYDADLDQVKELLEKTARTVEGVSPNPSPEALAHEFGDNSVNFALRFWHSAQTAQMWRVRDRMTRAVKHELDEAGIEIPFPQRVVHLPSAD